ncbi:hypothetical protein ACSSV1_004630 [Labrenzia sp. MBR-25]
MSVAFRPATVVSPLSVRKRPDGRIEIFLSPDCKTQSGESAAV